MRMKVCGMTDLAQIRALDTMGVDYFGLIFYTRSPRNVGASALTPELLRGAGLRALPVGVFVNAPVEEVLRAVDAWGLHAVQLHGDESPRHCEEVSAHVRTLKAFRVCEGERLDRKVEPYRESVDMFLFDTAGAGYGGTGRQFDWALLGGDWLGKPFLLSGGIAEADAGRVRGFAAAQPALHAVDVNSRFERAPGVKDLASLARFRSRLSGEDDNGNV